MHCCQKSYHNLTSHQHTKIIRNKIINETGLYFQKVENWFHTQINRRKTHIQTENNNQICIS